MGSPSVRPICASVYHWKAIVVSLLRTGSMPLTGKVAVVCGGSRGIGKATAQRIVRLGGSVCLVARNAATLEAAARETETLMTLEEQFVETIAADCLDRDGLEQYLGQFVERRGVPDWLVNCVGFARPDYVERLEMDDFRDSIDGNYLAQLIPALVMLPHFKRAGRGHVAFVSSMMGYFGIVGYAAYAPAKFAIVGLAEVLQNELTPQHIGISVLFPPDTDTPGFAEENRSKPAACAAMSQAAGCLEPERVARTFVAGIMDNRYFILPGMSRWIWRLHRWFPGVLRWMTRRQYLRARRSSGNI
jgi:3-dehydrosphinganine reductase